ncbi:hypothetical protein [Pontibacter sp. G13]|uniref:hypothetical protein n=1 Tax=Pontibacter sp. G13 TaxID=3074898 RepID=UPI00288BB01B|nr:hypothetical protein [Pontibacter sp. G13]WNJ18306.1 hypothetical protein RJD25_25925 [Pontibacter sp. G13]
MECTLEFKDEVVSGYGSDEVGGFSWSGRYDIDSGTCFLIKQYIGAHAVDYHGTADENGIWGKWTMRYGSDGFHIWPSQSENHHHIAEKAQWTRSNPEKAFKIEEVIEILGGNCSDF